MTQIEALLSVDAGRIPAKTKAVFLDDGSRGLRYSRAVVAILFAVAAAVVAWKGVGYQTVTLLLLCGAMLALTAMPTLRPDSNRDPKRQVMVITTEGVIVRDARGLRSWNFEDVNSVVAGIHDSVPYLNLIDKNGKRHSISCAFYRRGLRVRQIISSRLSLLRTTSSS